MKKITILSLSLLIAMSFSSCNKDDQANRLKIGMFVVGDGFNDSGYKQNCKSGLLSALEKEPFDTLFVSSLTHTQSEIDYFPKNGCDALFLAGSIASTELLVTAANYPEKQFVIVDYDGETSLPNVQAINYNSDEAAFPLGFLAASWALAHDQVSPSVAIIGGIDIAVLKRFITAYRLGVSYFNSKYNQKVNVTTTFLNTFDDSDCGYRVADSLIKNGNADVILPVAGNAGNGALYAAKDNGKWAIGVDADQYYSLPEVKDILLSSCVKSLESTISKVAIAYIENPVISNSTYTGTLKNEGVSLAPFHSFDAQIPDSIKTAIEAIKAGIIDGSIDTGF